MTITHNVVEKPRLKTGAAARKVGVSPQTLRRYAAMGRIAPIVLPSGRLLWSADEVDRLAGAR